MAIRPYKKKIFMHLSNILKFLMCASPLFLFCSPMAPMTPFKQIESTRIRPVGMVISPYPEGAPGDVLHISAYFAGKPIVNYSDFRVCKGEFDTTGMTVSINGPSRSQNDLVVFEYRLPDTILDSVIQNLKASPGYSPEFDLLLGAIKSHQIDAVKNLDSSLLPVAVGFLTNLNLKCRIMFTVSTANGESLKVRKDFMVRYNYLFQDIPALAERLPVNRNPFIPFVYLYKVSGDTSDFDPEKPARPYTIRELAAIDSRNENLPDTIDIDTGYSYFVNANNTIADKYLIPYPVKNDPSKVKDSIVSEKFSYFWFYEQHGGSSSSADDGMTLQQDEFESTIKLYPPLDLDVTGCTIWVNVVDYLESKAPRPHGSDMTSVRCVFRYTDAYRRAMGR